MEIYSAELPMSFHRTDITRSAVLGHAARFRKTCKHVVDRAGAAADNSTRRDHDENPLGKFITVGGQI